MYSIRSNLLLGFHGCDKSVRDTILNNPKETLLPSKNSYDWLANGIYFWENNPKRALEYATYLHQNPLKNRKKIQQPAVLGAILTLGHCLDLLDSEQLEILKSGYQTLKEISDVSFLNELKNKPIGTESELLIRNLDCAVIEIVCDVQVKQKRRIRQYDSVRGVFMEGKELYPNAGFREKNHIQICVRNPNCVKGYFLPRLSNDEYIVP